MEIRHFKTFKTIVELGSFTRASEYLGYAQSSVTAHIKALELHLGAPLFDRMGKSIILTDTGKQLLKNTNQLLNIYDKIDNMKYDNDIPSGTIKIGAPESLLNYRLNYIFKEYKKRFPKVNIVIKDVANAKLTQALNKGDLDIAFLLDSKKSNPELIVNDLIEEKMGIVFPPNYFNRSKDSEKENLATIFTEIGCSYRYIFETHLQNKGLYTDNVMESWSIETIKKCVMNGIAISLLPLITVIDELKSNSISIELLNLEKGEMVSQVAYHKDKWISPALKNFIELTLDDSKNWITPEI